MTEAVARMQDRLGWLDSPAMNRLFKLIAVVSLLGMFFVGGKQYVLTDCLAAYNEASNANQQARAQAAAEERDALDQWILGVDKAVRLPSAQSRDALGVAFDDFREARARIEGKRSVMPIPGPPSQTCG